MTEEQYAQARRLKTEINNLVNSIEYLSDEKNEFDLPIEMFDRQHLEKKLHLENKLTALQLEFEAL